MTRPGFILSAILLVVSPIAARTGATVVLADDAAPAEETAAHELAHYLGRVLDRKIRVIRERYHESDLPVFFYGEVRVAEMQKETQCQKP